MAKNLLKLCSSVLQKVELVIDAPERLVEISKQSAKGMAVFLLAAFDKTQEEREKLKKELLSKM